MWYFILVFHSDQISSYGFEMLFLPLIKHFLISDNFLRNISQLTDILSHFLFIQSFHLLEVQICILNPFNLNLLYLIVHKFVNFFINLLFA